MSERDRVIQSMRVFSQRRDLLHRDLRLPNFALLVGACCVSEGGTT